MTGTLLLASGMVFALVLLLPALFHLTRYLGAHSDSVRKNEPYEGGVRRTIEDPADVFDVRFFLVGIIFLIFDVEVLFMFPWAVNLRELGYFGVVEMFVFIGLLVGGLLYVYRARILRWI